MAEVVAQFPPDDNLVEQLDDAEAKFVRGEFGEFILPLDRELATNDIKTDVAHSARELSDILRDEGMVPWPDQALVQLNWPTRKIHIRFVAQGSLPNAYAYDTPSAWGLGVVAARFAIARAATAAARAAPNAGVTTSRFGALVGRVTGGRLFSVMRSSFRVVLGLGTGKVALAGLLVWTMLDSDSLVRVLKYAGKAAGKGLGELGKGLFGENAALIVGGAVAIVFGVVLLTRGGNGK